MVGRPLRRSRRKIWKNSPPPLSWRYQTTWASPGWKRAWVTGSSAKVSCVRIPSGASTRWSWLVEAKRVETSSASPVSFTSTKAAARASRYRAVRSRKAAGISGTPLCSRVGTPGADCMPSTEEAAARRTSARRFMAPPCAPQDGGRQEPGRSLEDANEPARLSLLAQATGRGGHQADRERAAPPAAPVDSRAVPQVIVDQHRLAGARRQWQRALLRPGPAQFLGNDHAALRCGQPVEMTPGQDFHAAGLDGAVVERRPDLQERRGRDAPECSTVLVPGQRRAAARALGEEDRPIERNRSGDQRASDALVERVADEGAEERVELQLLDLAVVAGRAL